MSFFGLGGPEWPLDAPQPGNRDVDLAIVATENGRLKCLLTSGGRSEVFYLQKHVAASLIAELARALAVSP